MNFSPTRIRLQLYGLLALSAVAALVGLALAAYQQRFTPVVHVVLQTERSGLLLDPGADVRVHGIPVGEVRAVRPGPSGGAELDLALDADTAARIPSGVTSAVLTSTPFGAKFVSLEVPDGEVSRPIADGEVLRTDQVASEANDVFAGVHRLLTEVDAGKLNETLAALATTLDGRGDELGEYLTSLDRYVGHLNDHMSSLTTDIESSSDVLETYASAAPDLLRVAGNAATTSTTLQLQAATLHTFLLELTGSVANGTEFIDRVEEPLVTAVDVLGPVTGLLARFSPALTCTVEGLNNYRKTVESILGNQLPGIQGLVSLLPAQDGYEYPRDLPKLAAGNGPSCFSLPSLAEGEPSPHHHFDDGTHVYDGGTDAITPGNPLLSLYPQLFGLPEPGVSP